MGIFVDVEMSLVDFSLSRLQGVAEGTTLVHVGVLWSSYRRRWSTLLEASTSTISHRSV